MVKQWIHVVHKESIDRSIDKSLSIEDNIYIYKRFFNKSIHQTKQYL